MLHSVYAMQQSGENNAAQCLRCAAFKENEEKFTFGIIRCSKHNKTQQNICHIIQVNLLKYLGMPHKLSLNFYLL